ncbi:hypothetical protein BDU57DRAFT_521268 [Ampelomyces quisqualis]|uniref:AA1-like domain-containing protein n=1 Tax=Ampelomyces quisqualis TaxID=50730 RepID=A0A6A5QFH4_AMPQU|nr:hypothetical protein BDU57DRAFT_521268 [Ampelomyces quisqualis]
MLTRLPIIATLATLAVADPFSIYWTIPTNSSDGRTMASVKMFANQPNCPEFKNAMPLMFNLLGSKDVSDSTGGGYLCDGCDPELDWTRWNPTRVQLNDHSRQIFSAAPYYITLYRNEDATYTVKDTDNVVRGSCVRATDGQLLACYDKNEYMGLEAFNCQSPDITLLPPVAPTK